MRLHDEQAEKLRQIGEENGLSIHLTAKEMVLNTLNSPDEGLVIEVGLQDENYDVLRQIADNKGMTVSEVASSAISNFLNHAQGKPEENRKIVMLHRMANPLMTAFARQNGIDDPNFILNLALFKYMVQQLDPSILGPEAVAEVFASIREMEREMQMMNAQRVARDRVNKIKEQAQQQAGPYMQFLQKQKDTEGQQEASRPAPEA